MNQQKISPAFEPVWAAGNRNGKREAIVIYKMPEQGRMGGNGRFSDTLRQRLAKLRHSQKAIQNKLFSWYDNLTRRQNLGIQTVGNNLLPIATMEVTQQSLRALANRPEVLAILPNQRINLIQPQQVTPRSLMTSEVRNGLTWGLRELEVAEMWRWTKGKNINVAVLDTGVHASHPVLANRVKEFVLIDPLGQRIHTSAPFDASQHGTHVCGTIAGGQTADGVAIGIAPEANLLVAGVMYGDTTLSTLLQGIDWAVERGADVINMSLGFTYYEPYFMRIFEILIEQYGVLPVVAIGNDTQGHSSSPGNAPNAFSVGALEKMARDMVDVPFFSSGASLVFPGTRNTVVTKPDVVAPGARIYSCIPPTELRGGVIADFACMDGTSMAAPHVSGSVALLMSAFPDVPIKTLVDVLSDTAEHPLGPDNRPDNRWGHGVIQPLEAFLALGS